MPENAPVYVYGVVASGASVSLPKEGVADAPTRLIDSNGLAAVATSVPTEQLRARRRDLNAHLRTLERVFEQTTIVPCSFGTVLPSEDDVRAYLLEGRGEELHGLLERLAGRAQLNVKAAYDEDEVLRDVVASQPEVARLRERVSQLGNAAYYENIRLGELVAGLLAARRAQDAERIHMRLSKLAVDTLGEPVDASGLLVLKASFLVERKQLEQFDAELDSLAASESPTILFESFGPLPPTAFVSFGQDG